MDKTLTTKVLTLCIVHDDERVLLGMKKRGFGQGKWNGFGGKVEPGEAIEAAAARELEEEAGIRPADGLRPRGILHFHFDGKEEVLEVHVFSADRWDGNPKESDEMAPKWFRHDEIPYDGMWPDDRHWLPLLLDGKTVQGRFRFRDPATLVAWSVVIQ